MQLPDRDDLVGLKLLGLALLINSIGIAILAWLGLVILY
jgi:hypothetical protein